MPLVQVRLQHHPCAWRWLISKGFQTLCMMGSQEKTSSCKACLLAASHNSYARAQCMHISIPGTQMAQNAAKDRLQLLHCCTPPLHSCCRHRTMTSLHHRCLSAQLGNNSCISERVPCPSAHPTHPHRHTNSAHTSTPPARPPCLPPFPPSLPPFLTALALHSTALSNRESRTLGRTQPPATALGAGGHTATRGHISQSCTRMRSNGATSIIVTPACGCKAQPA
jgi:hypothetical protein